MLKSAILKLEPNIILDIEKHLLSVNGVHVELTLKEFGLLKHLMLNKGNVVNRSEIMSAVWGFDYGMSSRTLDVHVSFLRKKLRQFNMKIEAIKSIGYRLDLL